MSAPSHPVSHPHSHLPRGAREEAEWDQAGFLSKWTYSVVNEMLNRGEKRPLQHDDLMGLPRGDHSRQLIQKLQETYKESSSCGIIPRLAVALAKTQPMEMLIGNLLILMEGAFRVTTPIVLGMFLDDLQNSDSPKEKIFIFALILSALNSLQLVTHHVAFLYTMRMGYIFRSITIGVIYNCLFTVSGRTLDASGVDSGKLINLISNDVQRFEEASVFFPFLWEALLEASVILIFLALQLNILSGLAGVAMTVLAIPVQLKVAKELAKRRGKVARSTDNRVRFMSEVVSGISSVKSFAWENSFFSTLSSIRMTEVNYMRVSLNLKSINFALYFCSPHVASFATFMVFVALGGTLTLPKVFTVMSLLQVLRLIIGRAWTRAIETNSEAIASCRRIEAFLNLDSAYNGETVTSASQTALGTQTLNLSDHSPASKFSDNEDKVVLEIPVKCNFSYESNTVEGTTLRNIQMSIRYGEILMVVGPVGSGKSSFLSALLGELTPCMSDALLERGQPHSSVPACDFIHWHNKKHTRIAFCSQRPWIIASTVKANIVLAGNSKNVGNGNGNTTFADEFIEEEDFKNPTHIDQALYKEAISMCKLEEDFKLWPDMDDTEIGERGVSVSGGQKARIALARALYSDADIYLLDDVLSAVDAHVGKDLFFEAILSTLKVKRRKAIVLATHQLQHLQHADKILVLDKTGSQTFFGSYQELEKAGTSSEELGIETRQNQNDKNPKNVGSGGRRSRSSTLGSQILDEASENDVAISLRSSEQDMSEIESGHEGSDMHMRNTIIQSEDRNIGHITLKTYMTYFRSGGLSSGLGALLYALFGQLLSMIADYWLRFWAEERFGDQGISLYKWVFSVLVVCTILVGFHKAHAWLHFALDASSTLHSRALWAVLHSPMQFFVANPTGRILNRFSRDQNLVDELCPSTFFDFIQSALFCLAAIILLCVSLPWLIILVPILYYFFLSLRSRYIKSSREIKRLEAISRSPIYADFSAALDGLSTLRAYKLEERITSSFYNQLDKNQRAWHGFLMVSRWLGFRLDFLCTALLVVMVFLSATFKGTYDVGLIGFALVYALSLSGLAQWSVRQSAEVENQMTAMERINNYAHLQTEDGYGTKYGDVSIDAHASQVVAPSMPGEGVAMTTLSTADDEAIDFNTTENASMVTKKSQNENNLGGQGGGTIDITDLSVTYRIDLPPVLCDLNIHIWRGCKAGIVGRTGSGKSSLLLALLRLNIISKGDIKLDGSSLLAMNLEEARDSIAMIPQEPHLFSSTLRYNLDPLQRHTDAELWNALEDAHIKDYISTQQQGLSMIVEEGGKNFSVGQRQLISLARAIVRRSRVVLMDEVTASIDYETDKLIQNTIRTSPTLRNATIITVAHRLRTIADSDLIGVVSAGKFVEVGHPYDLLKQHGSEFKKLAEESHEYEELVNIASGNGRKSQYHDE